jgi:DNA-binding beta-propeller fold protein YncE
MRRLLLGAVLLILACEGAATLPAPSQSAVPSGMPIPTIDVTDMMSGFPAATFFIVTDDGKVNAVALLNHALKYTIDASTTAQIASSNSFIYIADEDKNGARLRWIDQASGTVLATRLEPGRTLFPTGIGHGGIAVEPTTGRVLVLYLDGDRRVLEAYDPYSLRPLGRRLESRCGDRVLAAAGRVVVACLAAGTLVVDDGTSDARVVNAGLGPLVAAAISFDGTTFVGRDDGTLGRMPPQTATIEKIEPFRPAALVPDGIASSESGMFVVALSTADRDIGVSETRSSQRYISFPAQQAPRGGILAQGQFAFWITALGEARHIDLLQGFHETMVTFGGRVLPGGVGQ